MVNLIAAWVWIGGIGFVYKANRDKKMGLLMSLMEALFWPVGFGLFVAKNFYDNSDWV